MVWNFSRLKIFFLGVAGLLMVCPAAITVINIRDYFTPFETIVLCLLLLISLLLSLFLLFWGLENMMPSLKWGRDAKTSGLDEHKCLDAKVNHSTASSYAVMEVVERIKKQPELQRYWTKMANAEKNYFVGDLFNIIDHCATHSSTVAVNEAFGKLGEELDTFDLQLKKQISECQDKPEANLAFMNQRAMLSHIKSQILPNLKRG
jgi:hypothetical protein